MNKLIIFIFILITSETSAQNKSGNVWVCGGWGMTATFIDTSQPALGQLFNNPVYIFGTSTSNICDSATGRLLFMCNGARLWDTLGNIIENGDTLISLKTYLYNSPPIYPTTQGSLILPKGSNGKYYVFSPTTTDSMFDYWINNPLGDGRIPFDMLQYHVVDINANGGMGKVIQKNIPLLANIFMAKVGMMACRHANGYDWWLVKQAFDTNMVYTFLVTKDTVELKHTQGFAEPHFGVSDIFGQSCFSTDGSKYAFATGGANSGFGAQLSIADFDRCTGLLSNMKSINVPIDSTNYPFFDNQGRRDSTIPGLCFSPNDSFLYINKYFNTYQYEYSNPDSVQAWYLVHRYDTLAEYSLFGQMQKGIDGRIYLGKHGGYQPFNNVINRPNIKGAGCDFCQFCLDFSFLNNVASTSPPNMPDFNLGALLPCWPLDLPSPPKEGVNTFEVHPNPASEKLIIENGPLSRMKMKVLFNSIGQLLLSTEANEIDVSQFSKGVYYLRCGYQTKKVIIE